MEVETTESIAGETMEEERVRLYQREDTEDYGNIININYYLLLLLFFIKVILILLIR